MQSIYEIEQARSQTWASLIPGYADAPRNQKKKMKTEYNKMKSFPQVSCVAGSVNYDIFDDCIAQSAPSPSLAEKRKAYRSGEAPRKGNENMYVEQNMTVKEHTSEDVRRDHFLGELLKVYGKKDRELLVKFGMSRPKSPRTPKELVEWIKAGDWTFVKSYDPELDAEDEDNWCRYEPVLNGFRWTKVKEDRKGYDAAVAELVIEHTKFKNEIWAEVEPANFIKILEKFEKSKLH